MNSPVRKPTQHWLNCEAPSNDTVQSFWWSFFSLFLQYIKQCDYLFNSNTSGNIRKYKCFSVKLAANEINHTVSNVCFSIMMLVNIKTLYHSILHSLCFSIKTHSVKCFSFSFHQPNPVTVIMLIHIYQTAKSDISGVFEK